MQKKTIVVLDNIRSAHNVGSIFRTADAAGVSKMYLCGYTPAPIDRFGRKRKDMQKASLGAEETVEWVQFSNTEDAIRELRKEGITIVAVEQTKHAKEYRKFSRKGDTALIFGNEVEGIDERALSLADEVIEIPMHGKKESLNVSVAAGIILFSLLR